MSQTLLVLGVLLGLTLSGLLACTIACEKLKLLAHPGQWNLAELAVLGLVSRP